MNHLKSFELTLNETKVIKGVAILLMLIHHFFFRFQIGLIQVMNLLVFLF